MNRIPGKSFMSFARLLTEIGDALDLHRFQRSDSVGLVADFIRPVSGRLPFRTVR